MDGNGFTNGNDNSNLFGNPVGMNTSVPGMNSFGTDMTGSTVGMGSMSGQPAMDFGQTVTPVTPVTMQPADVQSVPLQPDTIQAGTTPVGTTPVGAASVGSTPFGATNVGATPVGATPVGATPVGATPVAQQPVSGGAGQASQYYQPAAAAQVNNGMPIQQGMPMQGMPMQGMPMQGMPMAGMGMPMAGMGMPMAGMGVPMGNQPLSGPIYDVSPSDIPKSIIKSGDILGALGSVLFGLPFLLVGIFVGVAMFTGIEGMETSGSKWLMALFPIMFGGAGIWVMTTGVLNIIKDMKENKKFKQIASYGKALDARAANVDIVSQVRVNGNSKQALVCLWTDPETGALHTFKSKGDYNNKYYLVGQPLRVYVNPGNLEEYVVDLSKVSYAAAVKYAANTVMNRVR
ncbi:MAG: hypothetical protein K6E77_01975 [Lachnospiraceae bacterium]|nr:hypothetical protein [Lachnospiraceae bacterium]